MALNLAHIQTQWEPSMKGSGALICSMVKEQKNGLTQIVYFRVALWMGLEMGMVSGFTRTRDIF